jgi:hypothetical protein
MKGRICLLFIMVVTGLALASSGLALDEGALEQIQEAIRAKDARWEAGDNPIFRLSREEQRKLCGAILPSPQEKEEHLWVNEGLRPKLPERLDWRDIEGVNWLTPIRNQGPCGSCVAFGTMAAFEGLINIYCDSPGQDLDLSEQHMFSCGGGSCSYGWWYREACEYLQEYGAPLEECLPYEARDDNCYETCSDWEEQARKISEWRWIGYAYGETVERMKINLMDGPLVGGFTVYDDFFSYSGGVYQHVWGDVAGGHCICIIGWDDADSCWIVKNSWGPGWGEDGYFRIRMGYDEVGIEEDCLRMVPQPAHSAYVEIEDYTVVETNGNGDESLDPGETFDITVTLENKRTWSSLTDVMGWLLPNDSRVTILDVQGSYPQGLPDGETGTNQDDPFTIMINGDIGIVPLPFDLYVTGTTTGSLPYSRELNFQLPITTHLCGWPVDVNSSVKCSPLMVWVGGGPRRLVAVEDNGCLHMWNERGEEVNGFPFSVPDGNVWGSVALGDIEGDGTEEIVFGSKNDTLYALNKDGTVAFKQGVGADIMATPAMVDLDGDGGRELIFGTADSKLHALTAQGKEYSSFPVVLGGPVMADAAVADLDGDGGLDLVVGATDGLLYALSAETGTSLPGFPVTTGGSIWSSPVIADLNRDGDYEVMVGSDDKKLYAVNSAGAPVFTLQIDQAIKSSPAIADLDGDNKLEVIFTAYGGKVYAVDHQGRVLDGWPYETGGFLMSSPIVLDIDGDGALEVILEAKGLKLIHLEADGSLLLELPIETTGLAISSPIAGDLDNDGDLEVAVGVSKGVYVWNYPTASDVAMPWPMYRGNPQRTGFLEDNLTGRPESQDTWSRPLDFALWQNYPNPFNPETTIRYSLAQESSVRLSIFNVLGQEVISLVDANQAAGFHEIAWDGKDAGGSMVASGLYFYRLQTRDFMETRKMVLLR